MIVRRSRLAAPAAEVWRNATSMPEINREMGPWITMTYPPEAAGASLAQVKVGEPLFTSWVLFLKVLPVDRMRVTLVAVEEGKLIEQSPMLGMKLWRHERTVEPDGAGCIVTDRLTVVPRVPGTGWLVRSFVRWFFGRRHASLRARYGGEELPAVHPA